MRKIVLFSALLLAGASLPAFAQEAQQATAALPKSPRVTAKNSFAEIGYGQPSKRGRVIFGELVPYGQVWRTGANMSTDITFKSDVVFGGKIVKKGTYALFTIPGEKEWTVILNGKPGQRGSSEYEENKSANVVEVKAPVERLMPVQEEFLINFEGNSLVFKWDDTKVSVPLKKK